MTILKTEKVKPIDFLYGIIGKEDRRDAPEGLAELYDDLCVNKRWVDKFNKMIDKRFPEPNVEEKVANYLKKNHRQIGMEIIWKEKGLKSCIK